MGVRRYWIEDPPALIARCATISCRRPIFLGDAAVLDEGQYYCDANCYVRSTDAQFVTAGFEDEGMVEVV